MPEIPSQDLLLDDQDEGVKIKKTVLCTSQDAFWNQIFQRFSSWIKLLRLVALLLKAKHCFKRGKPSKYLQVKELAAAELLIKTVQRESIVHHPGIKNLNPEISEQGLICVGGCLHKSDLPISTKHPAILPSHHSITTLLIRHYHEASGHCGTNHTFSELRQKYWILKGISGVRRVLRKCHVCRRQYQRPGNQIARFLQLASTISALCMSQRRS